MTLSLHPRDTVGGLLHQVADILGQRRDEIERTTSPLYGGVVVPAMNRQYDLLNLDASSASHPALLRYYNDTISGNTLTKKWTGVGRIVAIIPTDYATPDPDESRKVLQLQRPSFGGPTDVNSPQYTIANDGSIYIGSLDRQSLYRVWYTRSPSPLVSGVVDSATASTLVVDPDADYAQEFDMSSTAYVGDVVRIYEDGAGQQVARISSFDPSTYTFTLSSLTTVGADALSDTSIGGYAWSIIPWFDPALCQLLAYLTAFEFADMFDRAKLVGPRVQSLLGRYMNYLEQVDDGTQHQTTLSKSESPFTEGGSAVY